MRILANAQYGGRDRLLPTFRERLPGLRTVPVSLLQDIGDCRIA